MTQPTPTTLRFGEWSPDLAAVNQPTSQALNVIACADGYRPLPQPVEIGPSGLESAEPVNSLVSVRSPAGSAYTFAGTRTGLFRASRGGWFNATRASGPYTGTVPWQFVRWGDTVYAVNGHDVMQKLVLDSDSNFYDVPGMPDFLTGRYMAIVKDQLVLGYCVQNQGNDVFPYTVWWSGLNRPESFTPDAATQADAQDLPGIGEISGLAGGEFGTILGTEAWRRMDVVGPPLNMAFTPVEEDVGCDAPGSVVRIGSRVVWYGPKGWRMSMGGPSVPIGANRVDRYTAGRLGAQGRDSVQSCILPDDSVCLFAYRSINATGARLDECLCWAWDVGEAGRWTSGEMDVEALGRAASSVYLTDDGDIRDIETDDPAWRDRLVDDPSFGGGSPYPAAVRDGTLYGLQAAPVEAVVTTGEAELTPGRRSTILRAFPLVNGLGGFVDVRIGTRNQLQHEVDFTPYLRREKSGSVACRKTARFHRVELSVTGNFDRILGCEIGATPAGLR